MNDIRVIVVGTGAIAEQLCRRMYSSDHYQVVMVVASHGPSRRLEALAQKIGSPYRAPRNLNDPAFVREVWKLHPDYLVSADNFKVFRESLLACANVGCVNFHNGPLPEYRGLNIPTWAIWNRETEHAVCWHVMEEALDSGPVVLSAPVPLDAHTTAGTLTMDCMLAGLESLPPLLERLERLELPHAQSTVQAGRYYGRHEVPEGGIVDTTWPIEKIQRLVRALDYGRIPAGIGPARIKLDGELREIRSVEAESVARSAQAPAASAKETIVLRCADGAARLAFMRTLVLSVVPLLG